MGSDIFELEPGRAPNLGALLGGADEDVRRFLSGLALDGGPLAAADDIIRKLRLNRVEVEMDRLQREIGAAAEASGQTPSGLVGELITLQRERDRIRSAAAVD